MKKTIFTFSAIAIVCGAIFFACAKDDNSAIHTTYVSQAGTGTNPDPNHTAGTTSGVTTAGTTGSTTTNTTAPTYSVSLANTSTVTLSGTISGQSCSATSMSGTASSIGTISLSFGTTIAAGSYNVVSTLPSAGQVVVNISGTYADGGTVTVTVVSGKNVATFNSVTNSTAGTTLTGSMGCL